MQETQETWIHSLGWEDLPEEDMATHSSILAWESLWTEEPDGLQSMGLQRVRQTVWTRENASHVFKKYIFFMIV